MKHRFNNNPQMRIIYAYGSERPGLQMQQSQSFQNYINVVKTHRLQFDVVINDGHVKPQVAYAISLNMRSVYNSVLYTLHGFS